MISKTEHIDYTKTKITKKTIFQHTTTTTKREEATKNQCCSLSKHTKRKRAADRIVYHVDSFAERKVCLEAFRAVHTYALYVVEFNKLRVHSVHTFDYVMEFFI